MKKLWKFVKVFLVTISLLACIAAITYYTLEAVMPENEFNDFKNWLKSQYENGLVIYKNVESWVIDKIEDIKDYFQNEENIIQGLKLSDIDDYKISEYVDITVPYEYMVVNMDVSEVKAEEAIAIYSDNIMAILYLQNTTLNSESLNWYRSEMIKSMSLEYPEYTFETGNVIKKKIAVINVDAYKDYSKMYIAIAGLGGKTLIVSFIYNLDYEEEAEHYFDAILDEILKSIE